ncbi:hypothetical protein B0H14DRAFT_2581155 [Mycena olivaceomarginata]|nr:hypothetical protein B0H14DRAFT_2581155 [Mycena olivaceomarginata]
MYLPLVLNPQRVVRSNHTALTARLVKERLIRVPVCPPRRAHQMSICQCKVDAKGSIAPGSPASPAEVDNMHPSGRVDAGRIGRSVFEIKNATISKNLYCLWTDVWSAAVQLSYVLVNREREDYSTCTARPIESSYHPKDAIEATVHFVTTDQWRKVAPVFTHQLQQISAAFKLWLPVFFSAEIHSNVMRCSAALYCAALYIGFGNPWGHPRCVASAPNDVPRAGSLPESTFGIMDGNLIYFGRGHTQTSGGLEDDYITVWSPMFGNLVYFGLGHTQTSGGGTALVLHPAIHLRQVLARILEC